MMAKVIWPLAAERPTVRVVLMAVHNGQSFERTLLADTGAGTTRSRFELILSNTDWTTCGTRTGQTVRLSGAYQGMFAVALVRVQIPVLGFDQHVRAVGVAAAPKDVDGIASFRFLNRFTYGNFGDPQQFGLER